MTDNSSLELQSGREIPIIPQNGEIQEWKHVYFHTTNFGRAIPILNQGVWSVAFSHLVKQAFSPSGFSPVQEEIGWDYISVYDADTPHIPFDEILPGGRTVTFVLKKIPHKSSPTQAERMRIGEHSVHWRVAPKDIVAVWVNNNILDKSVGDFLNKEIAPDMYDELRKIFDRLSRTDPKLRQKMIQMVDEENKKVDEQYPGMYWLMKGEIAQSNQTRRLAQELITDMYHVGPEQSVRDLFEVLEEKHGVKIYSINTSEESKHAIPIR